MKSLSRVRDMRVMLARFPSCDTLKTNRPPGTPSARDPDATRRGSNLTLGALRDRNKGEKRTSTPLKDLRDVAGVSETSTAPRITTKTTLWTTTA